jgi:cytochrome c-type biogenesis protein CcmH/NrfG
MALDAKRETAARHADPAIHAATDATKADSARSQYWEILGHAYGLKEQWRDAGDAFAEAVRRAPYIASNYANLARSRTRQAFAGDQSARASALDAARRGALLDPNNWEAESVLAEIQSAFGEPEQALTTLALAVSLNQRNPTNDIVASEAATRVADPQRARALVERILEKKESALLRVTLAKVALRLNDRELALTNARRAIELEPGNTDALKVISGLGG